MALSYPLTRPTGGFRSIEWHPRTIVGINSSPFTGQQQTYVWPGQWWEATVTLPSMTDTLAGVWQAFFLSLNGREGSFYFGDSVRTSPLGNIAGTLTVGAGAVANATTLPIAGAGSTVFAVGDWLQVGAMTAARLHRVVKVIDSASVDVFPRLRSAYAVGTTIIKTNPVGIFRLTSIPAWGYDEIKRCQGLTFNAMEVLT